MDMAPRWDGGYGFQVRFENDNTWYEGVYTFDKSVRVTVKIPQNGSAILAMPLKHYVNKKGFTSNYSVTPQVKTNGDVGLGVGYSSESREWYTSIGLTSWSDGDVQFSSTLGKLIYRDNDSNSGLFLMGDFKATDDYTTVGPRLMFYRDNVSASAGVAFGNDWPRLEIGIGVTY